MWVLFKARVKLGKVSKWIGPLNREDWIIPRILVWNLTNLASWRHSKIEALMSNLVNGLTATWT